MPDPRASEQAVADYEAAVAAIDTAVKSCRYCKAARTRARKALIPAGQDMAPFDHAKERAAAEALCSHHRQAYRLAYVCSPVSETYWAS